MARTRSAKPIPDPTDRWKPAIRHLKKVDPYLKGVIDRLGPCTLTPRPDRFGTLVRAIVGQQISAKAAAAIDKRLRDLGGDPHHPERLRKLGEEAIRGAGLSGVKARYVMNLAEAVASGEVPVDAFDDTWTDEEIVASLVSIKGIGAWTAEMFLMFALNRPDVLPVGDLGIRVGLQRIHGLPEPPKPAACHALAEHWRPYRTIACWYVWKEVEAPPEPIATN
jgi:3-methyladenine DNA glycosylase/8-oxoguanine DNA glycosylase